MYHQNYFNGINKKYSTPQNIKDVNRNLINITRLISVNTIQPCNKNASHNIREYLICSNYIASPWMQSSIDPDINRRL